MNERIFNEIRVEMKQNAYVSPEAGILQLDMQQGVLDASNGLSGDSLPTLDKDDTTLGWN